MNKGKGTRVTTVPSQVPNRPGMTWAKSSDGYIEVPKMSASFRGGMPPLALPTDEFQDLLWQPLYDTVHLESGLPVRDELRFFHVPVGQEARFGNNNTRTYQKPECDTNLSDSRRLPKGKDMIVVGIAVDVNLVDGHTHALVSSSIGSYPEALGGPAGTNNFPAIASPTRLMHLIQNTMTIKNNFGVDKTYEQGKIKHFPSPYGVSGFAGGNVQPTDLSGDGLSSTTTQATREVVVQNGFGYFQQLATLRYLRAGESFDAIIKPSVPFVPNMHFQIEVTYLGYLLRQVQ